MILWFGVGVLSASLLMAWLVIRRPLRFHFEEHRADNARRIFRYQREGLEARFLNALIKVDPIERLRWEDAQWHDQILWARDRKTRVFLALIGVHFDRNGTDEFSDLAPRQATALFEYRKNQWRAEGKWLDETRPAEALLRNHRFEMVIANPKRVG